jgi:hypothetical protein
MNKNGENFGSNFKTLTDIPQNRTFSKSQILFSVKFFIIYDQDLSLKSEIAFTSYA